MDTRPAPLPPARVWAATALAVLAGTALQLQQPQLWPGLRVLALATAAVLALLVARWMRHRHGSLLLLCAAAAALAFSLTATRAQWRLDQSLPAALEGQDLVLTGRVVSLPRQGPDGTRFVMDVERADIAGQAVQVPKRVSLAWYADRGDDALSAGSPPAVLAGQQWQFTARLQQPHGNLNPHGFDLELWLFEQGIRAQGYVRSQGETAPQLLADGHGAPVQRLRQTVRDALGLRMADPAVAGVLAALVVGDQAAIKPADWDVFRLTGVAHLMSISGLHVTMLAWLAAAVIGRLWRLCARGLLWLPAQQAARWGGLLVAAAYALLAGWGVPAQRTVCMLAVVVVLRSAGLRWPLTAVLLAAALAVSLLDPWALLQPGFWLSFVAVALLAASEPAAKADRTRIADPVPGLRGWWPHRIGPVLLSGLRTQTVATVGLAPLSMLFFQQLSVVGFVANLVAIPLVTLVITPLALLGVLVPPLWWVAAPVVEVLMDFLRTLAGWPWALWTAAAAPPWAVACGLLAAALAVLPLPWRLRGLAVPLMLPLLAPPLQRPPPGSFEMVVVDVGQGTSVLVRTHSKLLVYDAGPQYSADSDAGQRLLLPLLRARGEREVHLLMLSHRDTDHTGGAAAVLAALPVHAMSSSLEPGHPLLTGTVPHTGCQAGQSWVWDGVQFDVLHPLAADLPAVGGRPVKPNALSCVLRVHTAQRSLLLTGDLEAAQEAALLARSASGALHSQVMLVPHHGSRTSSSTAFIEAVQPQLAVVQAGYRSRFGHPVPAVLERYESAQVPVKRSDRCGAVLWPALTPAPAAQCQRDLARRYWHHGPIVPRSQGEQP